MKLNYEGLKARKEWEKAGVALPKFDWKQMCGGRRDCEDGKGVPRSWGFPRAARSKGGVG